MQATGGLRVSGFPAITAHSAALGITLDLDSYNGVYTHVHNDDTPDGFPVWRTGDEDERFLYFRPTHADWVFNSALTPDSGTTWSKAKRFPPTEEIGPVVLGEELRWEVFDGKKMIGVALAVTPVNVD